jgi:hypothetical protein
MRIISLSPEHEKLCCVCLEDWSDELKEAGDHKAVWSEKMRRLGLRVKLALDDKGEVGGMIQYVPVEVSFVDGKGLRMGPPPSYKKIKTSIAKRVRKLGRGIKP